MKSENIKKNIIVSCNMGYKMLGGLTNNKLINTFKCHF